MHRPSTLSSLLISPTPTKMGNILNKVYADIIIATIIEREIWREKKRKC